ncbi:hypothetical protein ANANG_G00265930 [Anguilla anguilla]|uniref:Uncharacterized protein n=1 Tax=Anguilla anguilla TaxID=7936 RepID=A0A9D3LR69_ANGAN|nr:hypothetical protein ANANG_G00265930 [Anguilla anguilla]
MEYNQPAGDGTGHHRVHLHHAGQPAGNGGHLHQPALPLPHLLPDGEPGGGGLLRGPGLLLPDVQHGPQHAQAVGEHLAPAAGPHRHQPDRLGGQPAGHRHRAPHHRLPHAAAHAHEQPARGGGHRHHLDHVHRHGCHPQRGLELHLRHPDLLQHGAHLQPLLPGLLGHLQPGHLCGHGGSLRAHIRLRAPEDHEDVPAQLWPAPKPGHHDEPPEDRGDRSRSFHHLLDPRAGSATAGRVLRRLQRAGLREVLPPPGRVQLGHEPHHLLVPGQGDERHLQADPVLPAAGERQRRGGGGLGPLRLLQQPHRPQPAAQQRPFRGVKGFPFSMFFFLFCFLLNTQMVCEKCVPALLGSKKRGIS